jgi:hypothetical protein
MTEIMNDNDANPFAIGNATSSDVAFRVMWDLSSPVVRGGQEYLDVAQVLDMMHGGDGGPINHGDNEFRTFIRPPWAGEERKENVRDEEWFTSQGEHDYSFREYHRHATDDEFWAEVQNLVVGYSLPATVSTLASVSEAYRMGLAAGRVEVYGPWHWKQQLAWPSENPYKVGDRRRTIFEMAQRAAKW